MLPRPFVFNVISIDICRFICTSARDETPLTRLCVPQQRYARNDKRTKMPKWIQSKIESANTNLATQDAVVAAKRFLRILAQPYEAVCALRNPQVRGSLCVCLHVCERGCLGRDSVSPLAAALCGLLVWRSAAVEH